MRANHSHDIHTRISVLPALCPSGHRPLYTDAPGKFNIDVPPGTSRYIKHYLDQMGFKHETYRGESFEIIFARSGRSNHLNP